MEDKISDLYEHLGYWHNRFGQYVHLTFERRLATYDVTVSQWCLMITLYHGYADTVRKIAKILFLDAGAVTRLADRLENKNLLLRFPDSEDARSIKFTLTEKGRSLVSKLAAEADLNDVQFYSVLSDQELISYQKILAKLLLSTGTDVLELCPDFLNKPQIERMN